MAAVDILKSAMLIIHIGAGNHSPKLQNEYDKLLRKALKVEEADGMETILQSSRILDANENVNSGYGSSLNMEGKVSNDASILQYGQGKLIQNICAYNINHDYPLGQTLKLFNHIDEFYNEDLQRIGLVKPKIMDYANRGFIYDRLKLPLEADSVPLARQLAMFKTYRNGLFQQEVTDTVGLIHIDDNTTTLASSSGGNFMKLPGRVGCAAVIGCGISHVSNGKLEVSCMCSGTGEDIISMNLAKMVCDSWINNLIEIDTINEFLQINYTGNNQLYVGLIVVVKDEETARIIYYHTTETFYWGFKAKGKLKVVQSHRKSHPYIVGEYLLRYNVY